MKPKWVFIVQMHECPETTEHRVTADFISIEYVYGKQRVVTCWTKPHWYSRSRRVALFDWGGVVSVRNESLVAEDWLKEAKISMGD